MDMMDTMDTINENENENENENQNQNPNLSVLNVWCRAQLRAIEILKGDFDKVVNEEIPKMKMFWNKIDNIERNERDIYRDGISLYIRSHRFLDVRANY